jgi:hypothetical protein
MTCLQCGCDDSRSCEGVWFWVYAGTAGLCSRCVFDRIYTAAAFLPEDDRFEVGEQLVRLADRINPEYDARVAASEADGAIAGDRLWLPGDPL